MEATVAVTVRGLAAGGSGVADLPDGRVVFVPRTAPGDRASIRIERSKQRWALGSVERILEPGPERRRAPCPVYDRCGGCQVQHLPYPSQLAWKARFVRDALERIGGLPVAEPPEVLPSPRETRYRNRITFTLRRLAGGRVVAGFHALGRPGRIVDVAGECLLPTAPLLEVWTSLRNAWGPGADRLPSGDRLRLTLREAAGGAALVVEGGRSGWARAGELAARVPRLAQVWHRPDGHEDGLLLLAGSPDVGPPAFVQVNTWAAAPLVEHVVSVAGPAGRAVDAYGGAGEHGHALARRGWSVTGIELDPAACAAARSDALAGYEVLEGMVESLLPRALPADLLVVNPPRAGLSPEVIEVVSQSGPARAVYVSCDPATLARDVALLAGRYGVESTRCFDLFPQTAHVETVLVLVRNGGR